MEDRQLDPEPRRDSNLMRSVNSNLRQRSDAVAGDAPVAFFCECRDQGCYTPIWMSPEAFDATLAERPGWLLHEGHEPSALWHRREPVPTRTSLRARPAGEHRAAKAHGRPRLRKRSSHEPARANRRVEAA